MRVYLYNQTNLRVYLFVNYLTCRKAPSTTLLALGKYTNWSTKCYATKMLWVRAGHGPWARFVCKWAVPYVVRSFIVLFHLHFCLIPRFLHWPRRGEGAANAKLILGEGAGNSKLVLGKGAGNSKLALGKGAGNSKLVLGKEGSWEQKKCTGRGSWKQ